jgi:hypothetical protein
VIKQKLQAALEIDARTQKLALALVPADGGSSGMASSNKMIIRHGSGVVTSSITSRKMLVDVKVVKSCNSRSRSDVYWPCILTCTAWSRLAVVAAIPPAIADGLAACELSSCAFNVSKWRALSIGQCLQNDLH